MDNNNLYEEYLKQTEELYNMYNKDDDYYHWDYPDHDDYNSAANHYDTTFHPKVAHRPMSPGLTQICFLSSEYLYQLDELKENSIEFISNFERFGFEAKSLTKFNILVLPTIEYNLKEIKNIILSLKKSNTDRYRQIALHVDINNEQDLLLYSLLHEVGHCIHISKSDLNLDDYFFIYNNCKFKDSSKGVCNNCIEEKSQKRCNYYCEITADVFAFKNMPKFKQYILRYLSFDYNNELADYFPF